MTKLWCEEGELIVIELKNRMYQFVFLRKEKRKRVIDKRPWTFNNQMVVIHPRKKGMENDTKAFLSTQMWVQTWHIPVQWLSIATMQKVGKIFMQCHTVIIPENGNREDRYANSLSRLIY